MRISRGGYDGETDGWISHLRADDRAYADQFVFVGRIEKLKGIDILLRAWKEIENMWGESSPRLVVCGAGPMEGWCREYIEENELRTVEMLGFVPNGKVREIIAKSKALILPTQCYEGFPMTILEAYSVGTPVVGPDVGNVNDLIRQGMTGLTFRYNDMFSLRDAVRNVARQEWGAVRKYYEDYFGAERNYSMLRQIYESVHT